MNPEVKIPECSSKRRAVARGFFWAVCPVISLTSLFMAARFGTIIAIIFFLIVSLANAILYDLYLYATWRGARSRVSNWTSRVREKQRSISTGRVIISVLVYLVSFGVVCLLWSRVI